MTELKTIQQKVEEILRQYPGTRSDDRELIQVFTASIAESITTLRSEQ